MKDTIKALERKYHQVRDADVLADDQKLAALMLITSHLPMEWRLPPFLAKEQGLDTAPHWVNEMAGYVDRLQLNVALSKIDGMLISAREKKAAEFAEAWDKIKGGHDV